MSSPREIAAGILEGAAAPVAGLLALIPGAGPIVAAVVSPALTQALGLAADLLRSGDDAALVIQRIRKSPDLLASVRAEARWESAIARKFGRWQDDVPTRPGRHDTEESFPAFDDDPYEDL
jgi:hypothetical protein